MKDETEKKITIRFYRQFDLDLIYLIETLTRDGEDAGEITKGILRKYLNGTPIPSGQLDAVFSPNGNTVTVRKKIQYHVRLNEQTDVDLLEWIESISKGYRNTAIKSVLRHMAGKPCLYPCLESTTVIFPEKK